MGTERYVADGGQRWLPDAQVKAVSPCEVVEHGGTLAETVASREPQRSVLPGHTRQSSVDGKQHAQRWQGFPWEQPSGARPDTRGSRA